MNGLQVPLHFAGHRVHRNQRVAIQIRAWPVSTITIVAGPADRHQQRAGLRIDGKRVPHINAGPVLPTLVKPGFVAGLARLRNGVECPNQLSRARYPRRERRRARRRSRSPASAIR